MIKDVVNGILDELIAEGVLKSKQYNEDYFANLEWGNLSLPSAQFYRIENGKLNLKTGIFFEETDVAILFADTTPIVSDGDEQDKVINPMMKVAKRFIGKVLVSKDVKIIGDSVEFKGAFQKADENVTGVFVSLTLRSKKGECLNGN